MLKEEERVAYQAAFNTFDWFVAISPFTIVIIITTTIIVKTTTIVTNTTIVIVIITTMMMAKVQQWSGGSRKLARCDEEGRAQPN